MEPPLRYDVNSYNADPLRPPRKSRRPPRIFLALRRLPRSLRLVLCAAVVGAYVAFLVWWIPEHLELVPIVIMSGLFGILPMLFARRTTTVDDDGVTIRHGLRRGQTRISAKDIVDVEDPGRWATEVKLLRRHEEPIVLPYVQPVDVPQIRARLGTQAER